MFSKCAPLLCAWLFLALASAACCVDGVPAVPDDDAELKRLLAGYQKHVTGQAERFRGFLSKELKEAEETFKKEGNLVAAEELAKARVAYFKIDPGRFDDDRFTISPTRFAERHAGGDVLRVCWERYETRMALVLDPAREKLVTALEARTLRTCSLPPAYQ